MYSTIFNTEEPIYKYIYIYISSQHIQRTQTYIQMHNQRVGRYIAGPLYHKMAIIEFIINI